MFKASKIKYVLFIILSFVFVLLFFSLPYGQIKSLTNGMLISEYEIKELTKKNSAFFNLNCFKLCANDENNKEEVLNKYVINFKLFNLFNIKTLHVNVVNNNVLLGGDCVGISLKSKGVFIVGSNYILTKYGKENPIDGSSLQIGDVIVFMNDKEITSADDLLNFVAQNNESVINITAKRRGVEFKTTIKPALDIQTNTYKLGLWIKDDALGVGTLTFINKNTNRFGALGHAIVDGESGQPITAAGGEIYQCNVIGIKKGKKSSPGELLGLFLEGKNPQGEISKNCSNGIFGYVFEDNEIELGKREIEIGGRLTARPGKAQILTCINGNTTETFDIEIIKTNNQNISNEKSMVIRITDKKLIEKTGGIVQGMSGSPIIQNGKLIGAVTHVFLNDPTKGFGLYLDWMLCE